MSAVDQLFGFFGTTIGMVMGVATIGIIGVAIYMVRYGDINSKGTVILFRKRDKRAEFIPIAKEEANMIHCKPKDGINRKFVKAGHSWIINKKTFFLTVEDSGYTATITNGTQEKLSVQDYLKSVWGNESYEKLSDKRKNQIAEPKMIVCIEPQEIDSDKTGLPRLSSEDLNDKQDEIVLEKLARSVEESKEKPNYMMLMLAAGTGAGVMLLAVAMKWVVF